MMVMITTMIANVRKESINIKMSATKRLQQSSDQRINNRDVNQVKKNDATIMRMDDDSISASQRNIFNE